MARRVGCVWLSQAEHGQDVAVGRWHVVRVQVVPVTRHQLGRQHAWNREQVGMVTLRSNKTQRLAEKTGRAVSRGASARGHEPRRATDRIMSEARLFKTGGRNFHYDL